MAEILNQKTGSVTIEPEVIAKCAGYAALDCFGIVGMATISVRDGLAKLLKGSSATKGVSVKIEEDNQLVIDFHVIVAYGVNIRTAVNNLIYTVKYKVEEYTSMKVRAINVYVEGVRVID